MLISDLSTRWTTFMRTPMSQTLPDDIIYVINDIYFYNSLTEEILYHTNHSLYMFFKCDILLAQDKYDETIKHCIFTIDTLLYPMYKSKDKYHMSLYIKPIITHLDTYAKFSFMGCLMYIHTLSLLKKRHMDLVSMYFISKSYVTMIDEDDLIDTISEYITNEHISKFKYRETLRYYSKMLKE